VPLRYTGEFVSVTCAVLPPLVAAIVMVAVTGVVFETVGVNTTFIVQMLPAATPVDAEQSVAAGGTDGTTVNSVDENVMPAAGAPGVAGAGGVTGMGSSAVVPVLFTVTICVALKPTTTVPKFNGAIDVVAGITDWPKAAAVTKRRVPTIWAGTLSIEFLK
jgi:hypothetical protein